MKKKRFYFYPVFTLLQHFYTDGMFCPQTTEHWFLQTVFIAQYLRYSVQYLLT